MQTQAQNFSLESQSFVVADFLKTLGNANRLQILCLLLENGEMCVNHLHKSLQDLSQSALSQHLAKMREDGLISFRRDAQLLYYTICDDRVAKVMTVLKEIFCPIIQDEKNDHSNHQSAKGGGTHQ
ncbi:MAG: helix-turn-helix transcriptional regulator [Neisseriaceae bacterium]|nr:helix-turn-helix transcriptional regulator [Neisseriaceae bacterium]